MHAGRVICAIAIFLVIVFSGCGSEDSSTSATQPASSGDESVASEPEKAQGFSDDASGLEAYLEAMEPAISDAIDTDQITGDLIEAATTISPTPDSSWDDGAATADDVAAKLNDAAAAVEEITPPESLAEPQAKMVKTYESSGAQIEAIADALRSQDEAEVTATMTKLTPITEKSDGLMIWLRALLRRTEAEGVGTPPWLEPLVRSTQ
jgi:hypothetical protein